MQDMQLGAIIALLPLAATSMGDTASSLARVADLLKALLGLVLLLLIPRILITHVAERCFR